MLFFRLLANNDDVPHIVLNILPKFVTMALKLNFCYVPL